MKENENGKSLYNSNKEIRYVYFLVFMKQNYNIQKFFQTKKRNKQIKTTLPGEKKKNRRNATTVNQPTNSNSQGQLLFNFYFNLTMKN